MMMMIKTLQFPSVKALIKSQVLDVMYETSLFNISAESLTLIDKRDEAEANLW